MCLDLGSSDKGDIITLKIVEFTTADGYKADY